MSNLFISKFDELLSTHVLTAEQEEELVDHILSSSPFTSVAQYARENVSQDDAEAIALANQYFIPDQLQSDPVLVKGLFSNLDLSTNELAYEYAYSKPEQGTKLLDELLYYRSKGRI